MEVVNQYPIIIKKKIPYISEFLLILFSFCLIIAGLCFLFFIPDSVPSRGIRNPAIIPDYAIWLMLYSGLGLLVFWFLYKRIAFYTPGFFKFNSDALTINTKKFINQIPISNITKIELIDSVDSNENTKGKFIVVIYQRNSAAYQFTLKVYDDCFSLIDNLLKYDSLRDHVKSLNKTFLSESNI